MLNEDISIQSNIERTRSYWRHCIAITFYVSNLKLNCCGIYVQVSKWRAQQLSLSKGQVETHNYYPLGYYEAKVEALFLQDLKICCLINYRAMSVSFWIPSSEKYARSIMIDLPYVFYVSVCLSFVCGGGHVVFQLYYNPSG